MQYAPSNFTLFTAGYQGHNIETFLDLLMGHGVEHMIDVRLGGDVRIHRRRHEYGQ